MSETKVEKTIVPPSVTETDSNSENLEETSTETAASTETSTETTATSAEPANSQQAENKERVYDVVEKMPQYPGGEQALLSYIGRSIRYPIVAQKAGVQGLVIVRFVVNKQGMVEKAQIVKRKQSKATLDEMVVVGYGEKGKETSTTKSEIVKPDSTAQKALENEALRVVNAMAQWIPAEQNGEKVAVYYTLPIKFKMNNDDSKTQIRSANGTKQLFIIDGKEATEAEMKAINPNVVKTVDVLKDASATAIYGEKGKNGVVVITMKK